MPIEMDWYSDVHLISTYAYLSDDEVRKFATECQTYLIREVHEQTIYDLVGSYKKVIDSLGLVSSWMWFFRRSDVEKRNQWSNYSNWAYENEIPLPITQLAKYSYYNTILEALISSGSISAFKDEYPNFYQLILAIYFVFYPPSIPPSLPSFNDLVAFVKTLEGPLPYPVLCPADCLPLDTSNKLYYTPSSYVENTKNIMIGWGFNLDQKVREKILDAGIQNLAEKYIRTEGNAKDGLYCYNFCLNTDPFQYQPSGAMNLSMFNKVEWEFETIEPIDASDVSISITCDASGTPINPLPPTSTDKRFWKTYDYNYHLHIMEERYNLLVCENGIGNLALSR